MRRGEGAEGLVGEFGGGGMGISEGREERWGRVGRVIWSVGFDCRGCGGALGPGAVFGRIAGARGARVGRVG